MAEIKTKKNKKSAEAFVESVENKVRREDAKVLIKVFKDVTGYPAVMWGDSMIGYGSYHYKSERSSQEGDWPLTGFSPRKQSMSIYIMPGFERYGDLMEKLGKYKTGVSCLYVNKLEDIDINVLKKLIKKSLEIMKKEHNII